MAGDDQIDLKQQFVNLANGAASGQLIIEDGVADRCIMHCQDLLVDLNHSLNQCRVLVNIGSFGTLKSAAALGQSFDSLAQGEKGSGSLKEAIEERIDAVKQMEEMFKKAKESFLASDEATKDNIRRSMNKLNG